MDGSQGSSFIPKQPARGKVKTRGVRKIYVFAYVSFVLFFGTLIATAGTFFYKVSVDAQLNAEKQKLADLKGQFNNAELVRIKELERRLNLAAVLIDQHISVSAFLRALEQNAIDSISFKKLELERPEPNDITILLSGTTGDFNSVLFQRSVIANNPVLSGATFEELKAATVGAGEQSPTATINAQTTVDFVIHQNTNPSTLPFDPQANRVPEQIAPLEDDEFLAPEDTNDTAI